MTAPQYPSTPPTPTTPAPASHVGGGVLRSLRARLIVLVLLVMLPLLALSLTQINDLHDMRTGASRQQATTLIDALAQRHAAQVAEAGRALALLASVAGVRAGPLEDCRPIFEAVAAAGTPVVNIARVTPDGAISCSLSPDAITVPPAARPALNRALITERLSFGDLHQSALPGGAPVLPMALPLAADAPPSRQLLSLGLQLDWFMQARADGTLPPGARVLLTDRAGRLVAAHPPLAPNTAPPDPAALLSVLDLGANTTGVRANLFADATAHMVVTHMGEDGAGIILALPVSAVGAAPGGSERASLMTALGVFVGALALALVAGNTVARILVLNHLAPLSAATERLARGDLSARIGPPYHGPSELVGLACALDAMAERIAERDLDLINSETRLMVRRQSEERYRNLVDRAPEAIVVIAHGHVVFANGKAAEVFGAPRVDALIGLPVAALAGHDPAMERRLSVTPQDCPPHAPASCAEPARGVCEGTLTRCDNRPFAAEIAVAPVDYAGRPAWHVLVRDITARKEVERHLAEASKLATLGEVAAGLAHEISQPMNVIRVAAEAALLEHTATALPVSTRDHLTLIADQAARIGETIDHVRVFARPDAGEHGTFDAFDAARRAMSFLRQQMESDGTRLDVWFENRRAPVDGVSVHAEQIILNLLTNARSAMLRSRQGTGCIAVAGRLVEASGTAPGVVEISVSDSGGAPSGTADDTAGNGLGLSICRATAGAMGGSLRVNSAPPGEHGGTVYTLSLPLSDATEVTAGT